MLQPGCLEGCSKVSRLLGLGFMVNGYGYRKECGVYSVGLVVGVRVSFRSSNWVGETYVLKGLSSVSTKPNSLRVSNEPQGQFPDLTQPKSGRTRDV